MRFVKMHGAGNDYVYVDCFRQPTPADPASLSRAVSDRRTGIGADGLILIERSALAEARMRMFNADGSEAAMCGNGVRCVAKYLYEEGLARKNPLSVETGRGVLPLELVIEGDRVTQARVGMGKPILEAAHIPTTLPGDPPVRVPLQVAGEDLAVTCVSMGNPHCVVFVERLESQAVALGPRIESHPAFPERVNVEFVERLAADEVTVRVWERGSGETRACGSGACAVVVVGVLTGVLDRTVRVRMPGGVLEVEWATTGEVFLTGPAVEVFRGEWPDGFPTRAPGCV